MENNEYEIHEALKSKLGNFFDKRTSKLLQKFEDDITILEKTKYEFYDYNKFICFSLSFLEDEEDSLINLSTIESKADKSDFLNTTEGNIIYKKEIRPKTPRKSNNNVISTKSSTALNSHTQSSISGASNQSNNFKNLDRSRTPIRTIENNTQRPTIINGPIPNNISKRIEARRASQRHRDSTPNQVPVKIDTIVNKDKSPIPNIRSKRVDKSPYPLPKQSILEKDKIINNSNKKPANKEYISSQTTTFYNNSQLNTSVSNNNNEKTSTYTKKTVTIDDGKNNTSNLINAKKIDPKEARLDAGIQRNKKTPIKSSNKPRDSSNISGINKSVIEDRKKTNKTSLAIKVENNNDILKDKPKDLNWSFTNPSETKAQERSKTPLVLRRKLAKVNKKREFQDKGIECIVLLFRLK
jgi:hypothetical protein